MFCYAKYRGGVRRTEGLENTDSGGDRVRTPLPLFIVDVIGEETCRAGEVKETGKRCKIYPCVEMGITILIFSPCCIVALLDISYSFLRIARDWNDIIGVVFKTSSPFEVSPKEKCNSYSPEKSSLSGRLETF